MARSAGVATVTRRRGPTQRAFLRAVLLEAWREAGEASRRNERLKLEQPEDWLSFVVGYLTGDLLTQEERDAAFNEGRARP